MNNAVLSMKAVSKSYFDGKQTIDVLTDINCQIMRGQKIAIVGPSGSGKSTFLHLLGGLLLPTKGDVFLNQIAWQHQSETMRCRRRNESLGFVYQFHHLLPELTALQNVMIPLCLRGMAIDDARETALSVLANMGLSHRISHKPAMLSGGERQRVAIGRAVVGQPQCILADEPTGNLDTKTAEMVFNALLSLNQTYQTAMILVTHDMMLAEKMDVIWQVKNGQLL
jgi:lipoprotein-releasing system ATP-binding protein